MMMITKAIYDQVTNLLKSQTEINELLESYEYNCRFLISSDSDRCYGGLYYCDESDVNYLISYFKNKLNEIKNKLIELGYYDNTDLKK